MKLRTDYMLCIVLVAVLFPDSTAALPLQEERISSRDGAFETATRDSLASGAGQARVAHLRTSEVHQKTFYEEFASRAFGVDVRIWNEQKTNNRALLQASLSSTSLSDESLAAKSNFYSEQIVQPILTNVPRLDAAGRAHKGEVVSIAFFKQLAKDTSKFTSECASTTRSDTNLYCSYLDFIVIMIAIGIIFPLFTFIATFCFCSGRLCCRCACCCTNCGGKVPTKTYSGCERGTAWLCYLFGIALLILFSLGGFLSMNQVGHDVESFFDAVDNVAQLPKEFKDDVFDPAIARLQYNFELVFVSINSRLSGIPRLRVNLATTKGRTDDLDTAFDQLAQIASRNGGSCGDTCNANRPGPRGKLAGVRTSLNNVDLSQVEKPVNSSDVGSSLNDGVAEARAQLIDVSQQLEDSIGSVMKDPRKIWSDSKNNRDYSNYILWGLIWLMVLLSIIGMGVRKGGMFWCVYCCSFWLILLFFLIYLILFAPSIIFGDMCGVMPTQENGKGSADIAIITSELSDADRTVRIFDNCLLSSTGNFFDAFDLPKDTITAPLNDFNVSKMIPESAISSNLNASIYLVPMLSVQDDLRRLTAADVGAAASQEVTDHIVAMRAKADLAVEAMMLVNTTNVEIATNITLMKAESEASIRGLADQVVDAAKCEIMKRSYESLLNSICNTTKSLDGIWFSCFVVGFLCIFFLICNMKAAKRMSRIKIAPVARGSTYKGGKKNRVVPVGSAEAVAAATEKKKKKKKATAK